MSRLLLPLFLILLSAPVAALELYAGEVRVDPSGEVTTAHRMAALNQVLGRLCGCWEQSPASVLRLNAADLDGLVLTGQLVEHEFIDPDGRMDRELRLRLDFDRPSIRALLQQAGLPYWGQERPAVLLWAAIEDEQGVRFAEDARLEYLLTEQARRVGLEIMRPLGDVLDLTEVTLQDVRGGFLDTAARAARRYDAGVVAMLDLRRQTRPAGEIGWQARFRWSVGGREISVERWAETRAALIGDGLERMASSLAARYAVADAGGGPSLWQVSVDGIVDEVQYAVILRYLGNLSVVEELKVLRAEERRVDFELLAGAGLEAYLELGGLLMLEEREGERRLRYRLAR